MPLKGDLSTIPITTVLQMLCDENKTGVLRAQNGAKQVKFFIQDGAVLCVMGTLERARLGSILRNSNLISKEDLGRCLEIAREKNRTLGNILIQEGFLTSDKLAAVVNKQAEEIIFDLLSWEQGIFEYRDGRINLRNMEIIPINVMGLILETMRRKDELLYMTEEASPSYPDVEEEEIEDDVSGMEVVAFHLKESFVEPDEMDLEEDLSGRNGDETERIPENEWNKFWKILHTEENAFDITFTEEVDQADLDADIGIDDPEEETQGKDVEIDLSENEWKRFLLQFIKSAKK